ISNALAVSARPAPGRVRRNRTASARLRVFFCGEERYGWRMKTILFATMFCAAVSFAQAQEVTKATAQLEPKSGSQVTGTVTFTKVGDDVQVLADVQNLKPGRHGFHIHEKGDCSAPDAASAGAHFNPAQKHHGGPASLERHAGDLGNVEADASGKAHLDWKGK